MERFDLYSGDREKLGGTMIRGGSFIPYYESFIDLLFSLRGRGMGMLQRPDKELE